MSLNPSQIFLFENQYCHDTAHFRQRRVFLKTLVCSELGSIPILKVMATLSFPPQEIKVGIKEDYNSVEQFKGNVQCNIITMETS